MKQMTLSEIRTSSFQYLLSHILKNALLGHEYSRFEFMEMTKNGQDVSLKLSRLFGVNFYQSQLLKLNKPRELRVLITSRIVCLSHGSVRQSDGFCNFKFNWQTLQEVDSYQSRLS